MKACHSCGAVWEEQHDPGRNEACLRCGADMHCCLNCLMYDRMKANQCSSRTADPPSDKAATNSCDEFQMADRKGAAAAPPVDRKKALEEKWEGLFKG